MTSEACSSLHNQNRRARCDTRVGSQSLPLGFLSAGRQPRPHERLIRIREVVHRVGVHRGTIYKWIKQGRFPRQVALGTNSAAWYESEIDAWVADPGGWRAAD